jgi:hypothetical protein
MKEDILEQLVDDFLKFQGYFTMHNVKFQPAEIDPEYDKQQDCVASDIDVVGFSPMRQGADRVWVVSCKSWQGGFYPADKIRGITENRMVNGRAAWKTFREICKRKWADALLAQIERLTGSRHFTYVTAVTKLRGERSIWENHELFRQLLRGNPIKILTLEEMLEKLYSETKTTVAPSAVGRLLQVMKASGWTPREKAKGASAG